MKEGYYQIEIKLDCIKQQIKERTSGTVTVKNSKYSKKLKKIKIKKIKKHLASVRFRIKIAIKCLKL